MLKSTLIATSLLAGFAFTQIPAASAAGPGQAESHYTRIRLGQCTRIMSSEPLDGLILTCAGFKGIPVYVAEGDLRVAVAYGNNASTHKAAEQFDGPFNTLFKGDDKTQPFVIEWRVRSGNSMPYAAILRHYSASPEYGKGSWLVVTRIEPNNSCRVAVIAGNVPKANERAREMADESVALGNCPTEIRQIR